MARYDCTGQTAHSTDLFPTFAKLAGACTDDLTLDGVALAPRLLRGEPLLDRMLFWRMRSQRVVRSGPWKVWVTGTRTELFNLDDDLG